MLIQLGNCWGSEEENCINCENPVSKESWSGHRGYTTTSHLLCMQASFPHTAYGEQGTNGMVFIEKMKKSLFLFSFLAIAHCLQSLKWACSPFTLLQRHRGAEPTAHSCSDGSIPSIISRDSQSLSCGYHGPSQTNSAVGAVLPMAAPVLLAFGEDAPTWQEGPVQCKRNCSGSAPRQARHQQVSKEGKERAGLIQTLCVILPPSPPTIPSSCCCGQQKKKL